MRNPLRRRSEPAGTKRTLSGKRVPRGLSVHREWLALVAPPTGRSAVHGTRNADRVPERIRSCPDPRSLRVFVEGSEFAGRNRTEARAAGTRRTQYAERARLREWTSTDQRAATARRLARLRKRARRTGYGTSREAGS